jgi:hypothetical protein
MCGCSDRPHCRRVGGGLQDGRRQDLDAWTTVVVASVRPCPAVPSFDKFSRGKWADLSSCGPDTLVTST